LLRAGGPGRDGRLTIPPWSHDDRSRQANFPSEGQPNTSPFAADAGVRDSAAVLQRGVWPGNVRRCSSAPTSSRRNATTADNGVEIGPQVKRRWVFMRAKLRFARDGQVRAQRWHYGPLPRAREGGVSHRTRRTWQPHAWCPAWQSRFGRSAVGERRVSSGPFFPLHVAVEPGVSPRIPWGDGPSRRSVQVSSSGRLLIL